ncbi:hypothetical protein CR513_28508, partial [Mucuna pruriens]
MASNTQQFGVRGSAASRVVNEFAFPKGFGEVDGYKQHSISTKCDSITVNQLQSNGFGQIPSQTIINPKGNTKLVPLPFLTRIAQARKFELDEKLLQTFRKVEINIPLLDAIKQISKYENFLKELCTHKREKLKGDMEMGRNVSTLIKSEQWLMLFIVALETLKNKKNDHEERVFYVYTALNKGEVRNLAQGYRCVRNVDMNPSGKVTRPPGYRGYRVSHLCPLQTNTTVTDAKVPVAALEKTH